MVAEQAPVAYLDVAVFVASVGGFDVAQIELAALVACAAAALHLDEVLGETELAAPAYDHLASTAAVAGVATASGSSFSAGCRKAAVFVLSSTAAAAFEDAFVVVVGYFVEAAGPCVDWASLGADSCICLVDLVDIGVAGT